ncbi:FecR family protein [Parapedobacter tibetensis]|uniref:FecR family protein n=1 Tax=Parapedobacter tibetensis TaxID=2972951 RepID=UPI00214D34B9|nr:FecR family protein [Parapedobacter tibetensis]
MSYKYEQQAIRIGQLLVKQLRGTLTDGEAREITAWLKLSDRNKQVYEELMNDHSRQVSLQEEPPRPAEEVLPLLLAKYHQRKSGILSDHGAQSIRRIRKWLSYAAAILVMATVTTWFLLRDRIGNQQSKIIDAEEILPGGSRAKLTLADGSTISLDEAKEGIIVNEGNISYSDESREIVNLQSGIVDQLVLTTPKGGTYQLILPDGSKVWLNAASTLKYPSAFTGRERVVELVGEGYFAVAKDARKPFKVISNGQEVDVLGTEFNISAYADEKEVKTTLVEGGVQIVNRQSETVNKLQPGEQSIIRGAATDIHTVDVQQYTAWKDGFFYFNSTPLVDIIRQVGRWYDVEVDYDGNTPALEFSGKIQRSLQLSQVLRILEKGGVQFHLDGRKLVVRP